jgi:hypothetical protein
LHGRSKKLAQLIDAHVKSPDDEEVLAEIAGNEFPDLIDDAISANKIIAYLRTDPDAKFGRLREAQ